MMQQSACAYSSQGLDTTKRLSTLGGQFKQSLEKLMKILEQCQPYFIRCIKPNDYKKPLVMFQQYEVLSSVNFLMTKSCQLLCSVLYLYFSPGELEHSLLLK